MDKKKPLLQISLLLILAVLTVYAIWSFRSSPSKSQNPQNMTAEEYIASHALPKQSQAPGFELPGIFQETVRFSADSGKPAIINFWATWCENCKREMPLLEKVYQSKQDQVQIIMVHTTHLDRKEAAQQYIKQHGYTFPAGLDTDGRVSDLYRVSALPQTFFIDKNGRIIHHQIGELTPAVLDQQLSRLIEP
ncbi:MULTISPECIES: TlpA disulfide reductase family protein [Thermoactinomyces]|jgi:thiol-disulfide isomerase/thioredoxin|uniref:TlpA family protein disulfide reductase n=1 Tax=Thermoactinomyces vulgaris TaxID=2026 RepID=A0ABS0QGT0_THEVU|nr:MULTISPECIES: TlpA disulfide reductase family protein [Thermoactinomyces]KYQ86786.1 hypothetical protein AYX07_06485 [Thermoactinomyces sp. AS95]MBA4550681.1 TlpA family protein disulfide reductase [Thermoactinomyces vulgaris]MBA4596260.1 TlpA family protein disulfide reductase [Thermoactinomyces vulgaris]MBH8583009.1 TlpA family protein disulfide reductase [Thermoactinomyces sp. CICC 10735]MBH8585799.1 TlpA family protein disulfide reductase [Thermoactinomyces sp. CICC 10520]